jgi:hypothetical protein
MVKREETAVASIVPRVGRPKTAVPNVPRAVRVRLALGVTIARRVNTVRVAIKMLRRVLVAPLVLVKAMQGKLHAFHAALVNSTMLRVLLFAKHVSIRRTMGTKKETAVAPIVQQVGLRQKAV